MLGDLVVLSGSQVGQVVSLAETNLIGRGESATIRIADPSVSHEHCRLEVLDGRLEVLDLDSTNGVLVNGEAATRAPLFHGDVLDVGEIALLIRHPTFRRRETPEPAPDAPHPAPRVRPPAASAPQRTRRMRPPLANALAEWGFASQLLSLIELGCALSQTQNLTLLAEIIGAKLRIALRATESLYLLADLSDPDELSLFRLDGAQLSAAESLQASVEEARAHEEPVVEWEEGELRHLVVLVPQQTHEEQRLLWTRRPRQLGPYTTFERSLVMALAMRLDSQLAQPDLGQTRIQRLPSG